MKKTTKKKEKNNLLFVIGAVVAIIAIISGATYAYWSWQTSDAQKTNVSVTVKGATMTITGNNVTSVTMRPTNDCDGAAALIGEATVTVVNETGTIMRATPRLDVTLTPVSGRTFDDTASNPDLGHLHWALIDTTSTTSKTCSNPDYQGTFFKVGKVTVSTSTSAVTPSAATVTTMAENAMTTMNITNMNASNTITSTLTFIADPATINVQGVTTPKTTTRKYKIFIWLDDTYAHTNTGDSVTDPMQDLAITVKWSTNSTLIQE